MTDMDPGDCTPETLFDAITTPKACPRCKATDPAHCDYDAQRADGVPVERRPRWCLNSHDPSTALIPF